MAIEVIAAVLVLVLAVVSMLGAGAGLLGMLLDGPVFRRCVRCGHLAMASRSELAPCSRCRHPHLLHPVATVRHVTPAGVLSRQRGTDHLA